jgi:hypothetical protein
MAHAKRKDLSELGLLLSEIRKISSLKEKSFGCFYLKSKGVLHFHTMKERLYAHVYDGKAWVEVDLKPTMSEKLQKQTFKKIANLMG